MPAGQSEYPLAVQMGRRSVVHRFRIPVVTVSLEESSHVESFCCVRSDGLWPDPRRGRRERFGVRAVPFVQWRLWLRADLRRACQLRLRDELPAQVPSSLSPQSLLQAGLPAELRLRREADVRRRCGPDVRC